MFARTEKTRVIFKCDASPMRGENHRSALRTARAGIASESKLTIEKETSTDEFGGELSGKLLDWQREWLHTVLAPPVGFRRLPPC